MLSIIDRKMVSGTQKVAKNGEKSILKMVSGTQKVAKNVKI